MTDLWVVVPNWQKFQHRADRALPWMKLYVELSGRDDWRHLTLAERGLLVCIWIEYRRSKGQLRTSDIPGRVAQKVPRRSLDSLREAGFIELHATQPKQLEGGLEEIRLEKTPLPPVQQHHKNGKAPESEPDPKVVCPKCKIHLSGPKKLAEHLYVQHEGPEPDHWLEAEQLAAPEEAHEHVSPRP